MATDDYQAQLEQLRNGEIEELIIKPDQFMAFQKVFQAYPYRSQIEGDAKRGGEIHYHVVAGDGDQ